MKIGLAQYKFINNNIPFNLSQIEKAMRETAGNVDLLCFGESFLQGFDALSWEYDQDKNTAVSLNSPEMNQICAWSKAYNLAVAVGYIEKDIDAIYSSYAFIYGRVLHNYRRISTGWKDASKTDHHYKEGEAVGTFSFGGHAFEIALCGDLWDVTWERFRTDAIVLWPIYVNYSLSEWKQEEKEYAAQASKIANRILMVNSLSEEPVSHGGAFDFKSGKNLNKLPYDIEDVLIVEI